MRRRHRSLRRRLTERERAALAGHFGARTLEGAWIAEVARIELWISPRLGRWAQRAAARRGGRVALSPAGLTLGNLVLVERDVPDRHSLLFHELVHVVQFARLGRGGFLARYLAEWAAAGWDVGAIPMERDAYELQRRFERGERFDAEAEVARRLG
jgi:hypothetical protein